LQDISAARRRRLPCFLGRESGQKPKLVWGEIRLFCLYMNVAKLPEVLIKSSDWRIFGYCRGSDQTVHKMSPCSLVAVKGVQVDRQFPDLDPRAGN